MKIALGQMGLPDEVERKALFATSWTDRPPVFSPFFLEEEEDRVWLDSRDGW